MRIPASLTIFLSLFHICCISAAESAASLEGWFEYAQRTELKPFMTKDTANQTLEISSSGHFRCNGAWKKSVPVVSGKYYRFHAEYRARDVLFPRRSILARVYWRDADGNQVMKPEYPRLKMEKKSEWKVLEDFVKAPEGSATADLELIFRWDTSGKVVWKNIGLHSSAKPKPRIVKLATVNYRHQNSSGPMENLKTYGELIDKAGRAGVDMICLPEGVTLVGTGKSYLEVAETVPGPTTHYLGELARKHQMYIVAGIYEKEGDTTYNTAVLIGKNGELMGRYRKVSLPREEIEGGLTPGDEFPVFDTDFGRVGILICWDIQFPEGARRLASNGAEIIMLPIWGGIEPLYPARAIENQIILVTSSFDSTTGIWNRRGEEIARADQEGTLAITEVDLSEQVYWEWLGNLRTRIARESPIVKEVTNH